MTLQVRRPALALSDDVPRHWFGGDAFATHYMDALSSVFPDGEAFFVRSVLRFRDRIDDPVLQRAVAGFAGQEAQHSREHERHLALLAAHGYTGLARANRAMDRAMWLQNRLLPRFSLAGTAASEHLTALLARRILERDAAFTRAMGPRMAELWRWHALEEAEHKSVAFDVLARAATWRSGWRFLFARGGLLRGHARDYLAWLRRDFHPDEIDDHPLILAGRERLALPPAGV